ncbi:MAG TPA: MBL fold metallo-hydrolase [Solirubrobacteraceae bacterium]|nr:MBL fold metallo-hydrolase [Solirubrobacteraceae bacterium]
MPELSDLDIRCVRAPNPGPFTLDGTNTWILGRDPCWIVDPGPAIASHVEAVAAEAQARGGVGGIALTHDHADHAQALAELRLRCREPPVAAARGTVDPTLGDGDSFGPLRTVSTPGHAPDHLAFVTDAGACFTGDAVLGTGSVFIASDPGALSGYLRGLRRLRELELVVICPGHGPPVWTPAEKIDAYVSHRLDRERRLLDALGRGLRSADELLDDVWDDAPAALRPAAALTLAAHLDKLAEEGRLPAGVQRPVAS